jgi:hypothetical protein
VKNRDDSDSRFFFQTWADTIIRHEQKHKPCQGFDQAQVLEFHHISGKSEIRFEKEVFFLRKMTSSLPVAYAETRKRCQFLGEMGNRGSVSDFVRHEGLSCLAESMTVSLLKNSYFTDDYSSLGIAEGMCSGTILTKEVRQ